MSDHMIAIAPCIACGKIFTFNPNRVPSVRVRGEREPVCLDCIERANPERAKRGLPAIVPLPGAYEPEPDR